MIYCVIYMNDYDFEKLTEEQVVCTIGCDYASFLWIP